MRGNAAPQCAAIQWNRGGAPEFIRNSTEQTAGPIRSQRKKQMEMVMNSQARPAIGGSCDWCEASLGTRIFHYESKRYCCRACLDAGVAAEVSAPLFETKPFPPELRRLRAHIPHF